MAKRKKQDITTELSEDDLVVIPKKVTKRHTHGLNTLEGTVRIITTKSSDEEKKVNSKKAKRIRKAYRSSYEKTVCASPNCKNGLNGKPFAGHQSLFSVFSGKPICQECLRMVFGG